ISHLIESVIDGPKSPFPDHFLWVFVNARPRNVASKATGGDGVLALRDATSKSRSFVGGVYAEDSRADGNGLVAVATNGAGAYAVWAIAPQGIAAHLDGDVTITGDLTAQGNINGVNRILVDSDSSLATTPLSLH